MKFEPYMANLIKKWFSIYPKFEKDHLIFMNFGVRNFIMKINQKNKNFDVWTL
jgi:hypothetical protein